MSASVALISALGTLVVGVALAAGLRHMVHRGLAPARIPERRTPADLGLTFATVRIPTVRGKTLHGWMIPAAPAPDTPAAIAVHGWGGNAETLLMLARPLLDTGIAVLLIDARNHGLSDSDDFTSLPRFAEDLSGAVDWLRCQPAGNSRRIALIGHSVGASATLLVASRRTDIAAVVSIAAFSHPVAVMRRWFHLKRIPYRPIGWLMLRYIERVIGHRFDDIAPVRTIAAVRVPTLLIHGDRDETVPAAHAHRIYAARSGEHVALRIVPASHEDFTDGADTTRELAALADFLGRALQAPPREGAGNIAQAGVADGPGLHAGHPA